jgi:neutral ceramidase
MFLFFQQQQPDLIDLFLEIGFCPTFKIIFSIYLVYPIANQCKVDMKFIRIILNGRVKTAGIILFGLCAHLVFGAGLNIGAAAVMITPPLGTPMAGYYYVRGAEGVHDDLYAKTLVIEKEGTRVAIVSCDLIEITAELAADIRLLAEASTGIPADHIMISATHSHTGPVILSPANMYGTDKRVRELLAAYMSALPGLVAKSIILANDGIRPASLSFGKGYEETISFNRRFFMTDGTVGWNPGKLNPMIIKPAGPIDPEVGVLYVESAEGKPLSTLVNFALHLDITGGLEISADMPYTLSKILGSLKGEDMVTLFGQGCCGNINHINVKSGKPQKGHAEAERIGTVLAGEVIKTYTRLEPLEVDAIRARSEVVALHLAPFSENDLEKAREITLKFGERNAAPFMEMVNAFKIVDVFERKGKPIDAEVQVFTLGDDFAIVSLPGEVFVELGIYIKERSPYPGTMVLELANGSVDYIPDRKAFMEGNYEPVSARCAPGSGEILVERVLEILNEMKNNIP